MAYGADVMAMLRPQGGWSMIDEDFNTAQFIECEPVNEAEYEAGFAQYDAWKAEQDAKAAADKATLLAKLGITADEAKLLLS